MSAQLKLLRRERSRRKRIIIEIWFGGSNLDVIIQAYLGIL